MAHNARLRKVGGSVMLAIPPAILDVLSIQSDSMVEMTIESGKLLIEPKQRPRYTLDELLAACNFDFDEDPEIQAWQNYPAVGREVPS